jgi:predicted RND superfamily exporter protein
MLVAKNQALASFAQLALIGELTSIFGAFLVLPAIILTMDKLEMKKKSRIAESKLNVIEKENIKKVEDSTKQDYPFDYQ